jgi:hypothetical protein
MKLAGAVSKSVIPVLAIATSVWFYADLLSVPTSGSLLEKLIITKPVVLAIRISLIFVALGVAGLIVAIFWKQIGILKIGSSGIEFGKFAETSSKADAELAAKDVIIRDLEAKVESLKKSVQKLSKVTDPKSKG